MSYPTLAPTLAALNATKNDPLDTEAASQIDDVLRQTRTWLYDFLIKYFDDTTGLRSTAWQSGGGSLPTGYIRGTNVSVIPHVARELAQGTVQTEDIADDAVVSAKISVGAVTSEKIGDGEVKTVNIGDRQVTESKIALETITNAHIKPNTIQSSEIQDGAVTNVKIAAGTIEGSSLRNNTITGQKLISTVPGQILVGGNEVNGVPNCLAPKFLTGALTIDANGVAVLAAGLGTGYVKILEETGPTIDAGASSVATWNMRGAKIPWKTIDDFSSLVKVRQNFIDVLKDGLYLCLISSPAYGNVGGHRIRLTVKPDGTKPDTFIYLGTSEFLSSATSSTRSEIAVLLSFVNANDPVFPYMYLEHWTDLAVATDGLGKAVGSSTNTDYEIYASITLVKLN